MTFHPRFELAGDPKQTRFRGLGFIKDITDLRLACFPNKCFSLLFDLSSNGIPDEYYAACLVDLDHIYYIDPRGLDPPSDFQRLADAWSEGYSKMGRRRKRQLIINREVTHHSNGHNGMLSLAQIANFEMRYPPSRLSWYTGEYVIRNDLLAAEQAINLYNESELYAKNLPQVD